MKKKVLKEHLSRSYMPQLNQPYTEIVNGLNGEGISYQPTIMRVGQLNPSQTGIDIGKMDGFSDMYSDDGYDLDPIFVSAEDDYILDGHHRAAGLIKKEGRDAKIKTIKLNTNKENGIRALSKIQDHYDWNQKQQEDNKNVMRLSKNDLREYAKKVIESNLEEYDLSENDNDETYEDKVKRLGNESLKFYKKNNNIPMESDVVYDVINNLEDKTEEDYDEIKQIMFGSGYIHEDDLEEGPRTHSSMRSQRLKSNPEKKYASSRMRPSQRVSEDDINKYQSLKEKYGVTGLPSEELSIEEQEKFMEEYSSVEETKKKRIVRLSETKLKEIVSKLQQEYALAGLPIAGEIQSLEEDPTNIGTGDQLTDYELENYSDLTD